MFTEKNFKPSCQSAMKMNSPLDEIMDMERLVKNVNKAHRKLFPHLYKEEKMDDLNRHEIKAEKDAARREDLIDEEYKLIEDDGALMTDIFVKYASDLAGAYTGREKMLYSKLISCIFREAEGRADNRISGGE